MHTQVTMIKTYVEGCVNWFLPPRVNLTAIPNAFTDITDTEPTVEQIEIYTNGFFFPCVGATR